MKQLELLFSGISSHYPTFPTKKTVEEREWGPKKKRQKNKLPI